MVGEKRAADLSNGFVTTASTSSPGENNLSKYIAVGENVVINGLSTVTQANIEADNGVVHAVNSVIGLPEITAFAQVDPTFTTLVAALTRDESFDFVPTLQTKGAPAENITDGMDVTTFEGGTFVINTTGGVTITDEIDRVSNVVATNSNAVIHDIESVLFPDPED
ncbi:fasciclin domain-containing protein [Gillisia sp. Q332]|uniref:fasciclin domain-containing protein n=1 Tax=Gillisia xinjiangensis TaxID=3384765 RepID=UPI003918D73E